MSPKFGTSGLRGLVTELTPDCVTRHVTAFVAACPVGAGLFIGHDLRPSSPEIAMYVAHAARAAGVDVVMCGPIPTPALALAAMSDGAAAVMVTGSHIPADRNGLKFYTPTGEITKADETAILAVRDQSRNVTPGDMALRDDVGAAYCERYTAAFQGALGGMRVGLYAHSAVGRDDLSHLLTALGAEVTVLGWSDTFVPVDTEAVSPAVRQQLRDWADTHDFAAIVSTDGDGDRPLMTDENGEVIPGDILGQITAMVLGADTVVTPVSSNTGADSQFATVIRTKIGSPYVIAGMQTQTGRVAGYEANGGFLLGYTAHGPSGILAPLMTRDAVLPLIAGLVAGRDRGLARVVAEQPARFTAADRIADVSRQAVENMLLRLKEDAAYRAALLKQLGAREANVDLTDGLRMTCVDGRIIHFRASGNAPELRVYTEAKSVSAARDTTLDSIACILDILGQAHA